MAAAKIDMSGVLEFIKNSKEPVNKTQILEATGYEGDFKYCIKTLKARHEELETVGQRAGAAYIWKPLKPVYSEMKNPEGYNDPTAGKAIANAMRSQLASGGRWPMNQEFGEIWGLSSVKDCTEGILIVKALEGNCVGFYVYPEKRPFMREACIFKWNDSRGWHYITLNQVVNRKASDLGKDPISKLPDDKIDEFKQKLSMMIFPATEIVERKIEVPVEKVVEKVVERKIEVPVEKVVEKIVEKPIDAREVEEIILKTKVDIYERFIFGNEHQKKSVSADQVIAIADFFDDFLYSHGIIIPNEDREEGNDTPIYGKDWGWVVDGINSILGRGLA